MDETEGSIDARTGSRSLEDPDGQEPDIGFIPQEQSHIGNTETQIQHPEIDKFEIAE